MRKMEEENKRAEFVALAKSCISRGDWDRLERLARERLSLYPNDREALFALAQAFLGRNDYEKAGESLCDFSSAESRITAVYRKLGDLYLSRKEWEKALYYYERCLLLLPASQVAKLLGELVARLVEEVEVEPATGEIPADFQTMSLADLYVKQGHLREALEVLQSMMEKDPTNEKIRDRIEGVKALLGVGEDEEREKSIVAELDRWLKNIYKHAP